MPAIKYTIKEKKVFMQRLSKIESLIPRDFVAKVLKKNSSFPASRITNVRYGRAFDFEILEILEEICK